ncbi:MAG: hypothetical protein Q9162_001885 [Coniocarpon cinnabarinum]
MRNLKCVGRNRHEFESSLPCTSSAWNTVDDAIVFTLGPTRSHPIIELRSAQAVQNVDGPRLLASWDCPCPRPDVDCDEVLNLRHLVASDTSCLVLAGGDIVVVRAAPLPGQEKIEIVGTVDAGISAAAWSPDEELLAIATCADTLLYMTADFHNVASTSFRVEDAQLSKQVSVGWGRRETQFQGKRAKALQDPTIPEYVDDGILSPRDDGGTSISWRGDSAFVAISNAQPQNRRLIRVLSRDGALHSVTEAVDGLEGGLAWKPSGQLITALQYCGDSAQVIFFERNGLRHGELPLRLSKDDLNSWAAHVSLSWNIDSTVLAIAFLDRLQLWTVANYHYYLKQEIFVHSASEATSPVPFEWHPEDPLRIQFIESTHTERTNDMADNEMGRRFALSSIKLTQSLSNTPIITPHDHGVVMAIDGCTLSITPLRITNVPPPMALHELQMLANVVDAVISQNHQLIAVLHWNQVSLFSWEGDWAEEPCLKKSVLIPTSQDVHALQVCLTDQQRVLVLLDDLLRNEYRVYDTSSDQPVWVLQREVKSIFLFTSSCRDDDIYITSDYDCGRLLRTSNESRSRNFEHICKFPSRVRDTTFLGLTEDGSLFANNVTLLRNCTSFLVTSLYLLITTTTHRLKFIELDGLPTDFYVPSDDSPTDERCRSVERGAKLVAVMPSVYAVTLQVPRGNLETIYPRALVLAGIRANIDAEQYKEAFLACRNHRVDFNILHDHRPQQFLEDVNLIVDQLVKNEYIDLLLSQLSEEDVCVTLYPNYSSVRSSSPKVGGKGGVLNDSNQPAPNVAAKSTDSKVNRICNAFLEVFLGNSTRYLQSTITANLCKRPPAVETGLDIIAKLGDLSTEQVESAVEHICFLTDVNKIFDAALGIYNLDLALAVAQQSQRDPREYLPFLQNLQKLEDSERKFQIDDHLKRHAKALGHLQSPSDLDRFLIYTERHGLYLQALEMTRHNQSSHRQILKSYADFLHGQSQFAKAGIVFESLALYQEATNCYSSAQMWREALSSASLAHLPPNSIDNLAQSLADGLIESKAYYAAALILSDYLRKIPEAARTFCKGYHFSDAIGLLALRDNSDSIGDIIDSEVAEAFSTLTELISDCRQQLSAQAPRIQELRKKKERDPLSFLEGSAEVDTGDEFDSISLAPSETSTAGGTLLTRYTGHNTGTAGTGTSRRTSKNRRREERKRARGKKGSVYEEEYLVNSVSRLIGRVNETHQDVRQTLETLCRRAMWERARALQAGFSDLIGCCEQSVQDIWECPTSLQDTDLRAGDDAVSRSLGADGVLADTREDSSRSNAPVVVHFSGPNVI